MNNLERLASLIHRGICRIKSSLYRRGRLDAGSSPLPVLSVGNITFGGSEKTPLVMHFLDRFLKAGIRPAVATRGYKGRWEKEGGVLSDGVRLFGGWREAGDEPAMVARKFPSAGVFVGRDRLSSCRKAAEMGFDIIILDDGFQHLRLNRDLDIVLHDPEEKYRLRESPSSLARADILLLRGLRREDTARRFYRLNPEMEVFFYGVEFDGAVELPAWRSASFSAVEALRPLAVTGIARPVRFKQVLVGLGIRPVGFLVFPDHHAFPRASIERIKREASSSGAEALIMTEKDAVKLAEWADVLGLPMFALKIRLDIEPGFEAAASSRLDILHGRT